MDKRILGIVLVLAVMVAGWFFLIPSQTSRINENNKEIFIGHSLPSDQPEEKTIDFNHDGNPELVQWAGFNEALYSVLLVDEEGGRTALRSRREDGMVGPLLIGHSSAGGNPGTVYDAFFRDLDQDGIDELVAITVNTYMDGSVSVPLIEVYVWNGELFDYSDIFSQQVKKDPKSLDCAECFYL